MVYTDSKNTDALSILFICGSLEPAKDGIGDYVRQLSAVLNTMGHQVYILALNDAHISNEEISDQAGHVKTLRIPSKYSNEQKRKLVQNCIDEFKPNWISLQFVLYAYHPKGLPFQIPSFFAAIHAPDAQWEVMFHELWLGISEQSPLKDKVYGYFQRLIIKRLIKAIQPSRICTSNFLYQSLLFKIDNSIDIVPLFSNIQISEPNEDYIQRVFEQLHITEENRKSKKLIVIFGSIYPASNLDNTIHNLLKAYSSFSLQIIGIGKLSPWANAEFESLSQKYKGQLNMIHYGILEAWQISNMLQVADLGIACTPLEHLGKSGVYAAYKLHGLQVVVSNEKTIPEFNKLKDLYKIFSEKPSNEWSATFIVEEYVSKLLSTEKLVFQKNKILETNN